MSDVWLGRINRYIEKLFNVKGGPTVVDVDASVQTTIELQTGVEDRYLQGWNRYAVATATTAVAAQNSSVQITNPTGSNIVLVIEKMNCKLAVGVATFSQFNLTMASGVADLTTVMVPQRLDARQITASSQGRVSLTSNAPVLANNIWLGTLTGNTNGYDFITTHNQELTLLPGDTYRITDNTVNEVLVVNYQWRERVLETSELT